MKNCIVCGKKNFKKVFDCGEMYQSQFIDSPSDTESLPKFRTQLKECQSCGMVQLNELLAPDTMYREYFYRSSTNSSMVESLKDVASHAMKYRPSAQELKILDIGCNDGTLLKIFGDYRVKLFRVGFDPANNLAPFASQNCDVFINDYFNGNVYFNNTKFDIITSIAMFYDVPKPHEFIKNIKKHLSFSGIWVIQMTDILSMFMSGAFDNIVHEHIAYYSLKVMNNILTQHGLRILDISYNNVNGSSVRLVVGHDNYIGSDLKVSPSVEQYLNLEKNLFSVYNWDSFRKKIKIVKGKILAFLANHPNVYAIGASTKGNTLLQMFSLNQDNIKAVLEVNPDKFCKYMVGSNIPIISEEAGFSQNPEYLLVLPWHFIENFKTKYVDFLEKGGKFIVPLPNPQIVSKECVIDL